MRTNPLASRMAHVRQYRYKLIRQLAIRIAKAANPAQRAWRKTKGPSAGPCEMALVGESCRHRRFSQRATLLNNQSPGLHQSAPTNILAHGATKMSAKYAGAIDGVNFRLRSHVT